MQIPNTFTFLLYYQTRFSNNSRCEKQDIAFFNVCRPYLTLDQHKMKNSLGLQSVKSGL